MNKYDSYQDTGIEWIGRIPSEWDLIKGKYLFLSIKEINKNLQCKNLLSLTYDGVLNKDYESSEGLRPENYNTYQIFKKKDLVFKMIDLKNVKTSRVGIVHEDGIMSSAYIRQEPIKEKIDSKFAYWFYYDLYKKEIYNSIGSGVRSTLSSSDLLEIELPIPPLKEQKLISLYLDKKSNQINLLIEKIKNKIELLKEQRTSFITQSITKGLDPNAEMKNSNIEYVGDIPKNWRVSKIKYVCQIFGRIGYRGYTVNDIVGENEGCITLGPGNIYEQKLILKNLTYLSFKKYEESPEIQIFNDDILFVKTGSTIGKSCIVKDVKTKMTINPQLIVLKNIKILHDYLYYLSICRYFQSFFDTEQSGGSTPAISQEKIENFKILIPPINEQDKIVKFLEKNLYFYNSLIKKYNKNIYLQKEYLQSLVSSIVTGKIKVTEDMI